MVRKVKNGPARPLDPDMMGRMGEARFGEMCDAAGLIANDSRRADRMGWDYHVEFPLPHQRIGEPFDSRSKLPDMKFQVKTIWADRSSVDIDLSAAERLARWDYPSFIVILRINTNKSFRDAIIIHLIDDNLARVLKSLRQAEAGGSLSIKDKTVSFRVHNGARISIDGPALAAALQAAIGGKPEAYIARKSGQLKNLGFEKTRFRGSFTLSARDESEVLDIFLGMKRCDAIEFQAEEVRFGIPIRQIPKQSVQLQFKPHSITDCEPIFVSQSRERKHAVLDAKLYFASTDFDSSAPWKVRLVSNFFEMIASSEEKEASLTLGSENERRLSLEYSIRLYRTCVVLASGPCIASVRVSGRHLLSFSFSDVNLPLRAEHYLSRLNFVRELAGILRSIGLSNIKLTNQDVSSNFDTIRLIFAAQKFENAVKMSMKVSTPKGGPVMPENLEGLFASTLVFEEATVVFWALVQVKAIPSDGSIKLQLSNFSLRDLRLLEAHESIDDFVTEASTNSGLGFIVRMDRIGNASPTPEQA